MSTSIRRAIVSWYERILRSIPAKPLGEGEEGVQKSKATEIRNFVRKSKLNPSFLVWKYIKGDYVELVVDFIMFFPSKYYLNQGRIKLFGAPRQWKHFLPLFQAVFLSGGGITPPDWDKHHAYQSQDRNNKYFILYIEFVAADILFRLARMRHAWKGDCYLTVLVFSWQILFLLLKFTLMFIHERKRNANTYLISNFGSLEAAPWNLPP